MRNDYGNDHDRKVPNEAKNWNWGAFFLTFVWGLYHRVYLSLLVFVPIVGIVIPFILGAKGSEWAWKRKEWESVEEFTTSQRWWRNLGLAVTLGVVIAFPIIIGLLNILYVMGDQGR
ncbi:DUF2628 domain-containing protein [Marininema halotolerans]|uniref:Uncharacterized protein n=1 Tax=Marininema halotolerans TaxID=1155944 RepID=A0A1I6RH29_9BACL|nr:DUF2628 domain-containing protein [Marininema halotolerans]SFS63975.1 Protein of unknown function [Marininema halotolerans]